MMEQEDGSRGLHESTIETQEELKDRLETAMVDMEWVTKINNFFIKKKNILSGTIIDIKK